jgi:hypothetical protein
MPGNVREPKAPPRRHRVPPLRGARLEDMAAIQAAKDSVEGATAGAQPSQCRCGVLGSSVGGVQQLL